MKRLFYVAMFAFAIFISPTTSRAQATGEWVQCLDPGGSGHVVSCFIPNSSRRQVSQQVVVIVNQPVVEHPRYDSNQHYWESQQRTTSRRSYSGGIDRWTGRPYGNVEYQTETVTVRAEANSLSFRPTIIINQNYWPSYRGW